MKKGDWKGLADSRKRSPLPVADALQVNRERRTRTVANYNDEDDVGPKCSICGIREEDGSTLEPVRLVVWDSLPGWPRRTLCEECVIDESEDDDRIAFEMAHGPGRI